MIRKQRSDSQFDIFKADAILDREPSFLRTDTPEEIVLQKTPDPVKEKTPESGESRLHAEDEPVETGGDDEPETNELLKNDPERRIINRDFADGFRLETEEDIAAPGTTTTMLAAVRFSRGIKIATLVIQLCFILLLINWQSWVMESPLFTVKAIDVRGQWLTTRDEILKLSELETGGRLADVDVATAANRVMKNPMFENVVVSRSYPSTIVITVYERKPVAFVTADQLYAIDRHAVVLPRLRPAQVYNLPVISGNGRSIHPGKRLAQDDVKFVLNFLAVVQSLDPAMYNEISEIMMRKDSYLVQVNSLPVLFRVDDQQPLRGAAYLTAAFRAFRQKDLRGIREIDCRFDGHVVVIEKAKT
jgi:cell division protein FtsQ